MEGSEKTESATWASTQAINTAHVIVANNQTNSAIRTNENGSTRCCPTLTLMDCTPAGILFFAQEFPERGHHLLVMPAAAQVCFCARGEICSALCFLEVF
jgi:hypothetical protein